MQKSEKVILKKAVRIPKDTVLETNTMGINLTMYVPSVELIIGIGKDHVAHLVMTQEAFDALQAGEKLQF